MSVTPAAVDVGSAMVEFLRHDHLGSGLDDVIHHQGWRQVRVRLATTCRAGGERAAACAKKRADFTCKTHTPPCCGAGAFLPRIAENLIMTMGARRRRPLTASPSFTPRLRRSTRPNGRRLIE